MLGGYPPSQDLGEDSIWRHEAPEWAWDLGLLGGAAAIVTWAKGTHSFRVGSSVDRLPGTHTPSTSAIKLHGTLLLGTRVPTDTLCAFLF